MGCSGYCSDNFAASSIPLARAVLELFSIRIILDLALLYYGGLSNADKNWTDDAILDNPVHNGTHSGSSSECNGTNTYAGCQSANWY